VRRRRRSTRAAVAALLALAVAASGVLGCGKKRAKRIERDRDAAAVVFVDRAAAATVELSDEVEPNDEESQANPVALGAGVRGSLDGESDVDVFRVEVPGDGVLGAQLSGIEGVDLILELRDKDGKVLAVSDRGPALTAEGIPNYAVGQGSYYLAVREFVRKRRKDAPGREGPSPTYELVVTFADEVPEGFEREPNESADGALEVLLGDEVQGYYGWNRDVDMWKLSLEGFSTSYSLDLDLDGVPVVTPTLEILDGKGGRVLARSAGQGDGLRVRNLVPEEGSAFYYARISGRRSNPLDPYRLRVSTRLLDPDEEVEPNDTPETAGPLRDDSRESEGSRRGYIGPGDVDYYRLEAVGEPMLLSVVVEPSGDVDVKLEVATDKGAMLGASDAGKRGAREELSAVPVPAGTAVLVKLTAEGAIAEPYQLRWSVEPDVTVAPPPGLDDFFDDYDD
jgi:hypothetical protein